MRPPSVISTLVRAFQSTWVLDLDGRRLIVHRNPQQDKYERIDTLSEQDAVSPVSRLDVSFAVAALIP
jgi:Uma2 family endonuclease